MFTAANAAALLGWATRLATRGQPRPLQITCPPFPTIHKDTRQPGCVSIYRRSNVRQLSTSTQCMCVCVCMPSLCMCVCVCNCIASCLTPTRHNVSLTSPSLPISQFAPLYTSPTLPPPKYKHKVQTMQSEKKQFSMLASIIAPPLCFSFFFFYLLPFELWQTCAKSHSVLFSACCCCCTETNQFGKHHLLLLRKQRRQLKRHAELQLHTGCLSLVLTEPALPTACASECRR